MIGPLQVGSIQARLLYRLVAGEQLIVFDPGEHPVAELTAEVVFRLMRIKASPLVVWMTWNDTTVLADELAAHFLRFGDDLVIRPHDQRTGMVRHPVGAFSGDNADVIPMVESVWCPQQVMISHLAIFDLDYHGLPWIEQPCLSQVLVAARAGQTASTPERLFAGKLAPAGRLRNDGRPWGDMPIEVALAGSPE